MEQIAQARLGATFGGLVEMRITFLLRQSRLLSGDRIGSGPTFWPATANLPSHEISAEARDYLHIILASVLTTTEFAGGRREADVVGGRPARVRRLAHRCAVSIGDGD